MPSNTLEAASRAESRRRRLTWTFFWAWSIFIFQGAILPPYRIPRLLVRFNDKLLHGVEYFILFFAAFNAFRLARGVWFHCRPLFNALLWCFWMGLVTEWAQSFVPDRYPSVGDFAADFVGAMLGVLLYILFRRRSY